MCVDIFVRSRFRGAYDISDHVVIMLFYLGAPIARIRNLDASTAHIDY